MLKSNSEQPSQFLEQLLIVPDLRLRIPMVFIYDTGIPNFPSFNLARNDDVPLQYVHIVETASSKMMRHSWISTAARSALSGWKRCPSS